MLLWRFITQIFSNKPKIRPQEQERRYDNVQVVSMADGTTIMGHEAVEAYFEKEQEIYSMHGSFIYFQVYWVNLQATTIEELQGGMILEVKVDHDFVTKYDTVGAVKEKVHSLLETKLQSQLKEEVQPDMVTEKSDHITFFFNGRPMRDNTAFYADNFIMLPAWIQVLIHRCEFEELIQLIAKAESNSREQSTQQRL
jgi:hypothetical protein